MSGYSYDPHAFDLLHELFGKQQGHMQAISSYVGSNCSAGGAFSGILSPLHGHYSAAYSDARSGLQNGASIAEHCASKISESKEQVLADDKAAYDKMAELSKRAGHPMPGWQPPAGSTGGLGEGGEVGEPAENKLTGFMEWAATNRARYETASQVPGRALTDPLDPFAPGDMSMDQYADPRSIIKHQIDKYLHNTQQSRYEQQAVNDPGGHDAGYFQHQAELERQYRYEHGFASGQSYAQEHLHTNAGSTSLHDSPWSDGEGRETLHTAAEVPGKVLNIAMAGPALVHAGEHLHESQETSQELDQTAAGPSNTGSYNWAHNDNNGGEW